MKLHFKNQLPWNLARYYLELFNIDSYKKIYIYIFLYIYYLFRLLNY